MYCSIFPLCGFVRNNIYCVSEGVISTTISLVAGASRRTGSKKRTKRAGQNDHVNLTGTAAAAACDFQTRRYYYKTSYAV